MVFDGFLKCWPYGSAKEEELPKLEVGEILKLKESKGNQHFTKPPAAYNTASLVKMMEENGIGRPSTYATIISTLLDRGYIEKLGKAFKPTDLGKKICIYLTTNFPELMNMNYTARIEDKLDAIAAGKKIWHKIVAAFFSELSTRLDASRDSESMKERQESEYTCPLCKKNKLIKHFGKFGPFYGCSGYFLKGKDKCKGTFKIGKNDEPIEKEKKEVKYIEGVECDKCGSKMVIRISKKTGKEFYGCISYPKCRGMLSLDGKPIEFKKFKKK
jgi:DNA topoisomerase-1